MSRTETLLSGFTYKGKGLYSSQHWIPSNKVPVRFQRGRPAVRQVSRCTWDSTKGGSTILPAQSVTVSSPGMGSKLGAICANFPSVTRMSTVSWALPQCRSFSSITVPSSLKIYYRSFRSSSPTKKQIAATIIAFRAAIPQCRVLATAAPSTMPAMLNQLTAAV